MEKQLEKIMAIMDKLTDRQEAAVRDMKGELNPNYKHGAAKRGIMSREYRIWAGLKSRCNNPKDTGYKYYGGRGIMVCDEWNKKGGFKLFLQDMGYCPSSVHTIERIDHNGNYEPSNCKWATVAEQGRNTRKNRIIEFNGRKMILEDWAKELGINQSSLIERLNSNNWTFEEAMTSPKQLVKREKTRHLKRIINLNQKITI